MTWAMKSQIKKIHQIDLNQSFRVLLEPEISPKQFNQVSCKYCMIFEIKTQYDFCFVNKYNWKSNSSFMQILCDLWYEKRLSMFSVLLMNISNYHSN